MQQLALVYGKIIVDTIRLRSGGIVRSTLGGGGPQAAFGMRLWHEPVALLTRSGSDLEAELVDQLQALGVDLRGWMRYSDLPTARGLIEYDENERMQAAGLTISRKDWFALLDRPIPLPDPYQAAQAIHLVTEFGNEPMAQTALALQRQGALVSLEPIFDLHSCTDQSALLTFTRQSDLVTPDWPAASTLANSTDPRTVVQYWARLGPRAVAIRHGANGSYVWDAISQQAWHIPPLPVTVVDPTGAGNAYGGGWCAGWIAHQNARQAGCYATVSAALMLSHAGMPALNQSARSHADQLLLQALEHAYPI